MVEAGSRHHWGWVVGVLLLWTASGATAQPTLVSLDLQEVPLDRALERIASETSISLVYDADLVRGFQTSCTLREAAPEALLGCVLEGQPVDYVRASSGTYVLREAIRRPPQRGVLKGVVRDAEEGTPLSHAHIRLPEASTGTVTDTSGRFRLSGLLAGAHPVVVSHLGYERHEASLTVDPESSSTHTIALSPAPLVTDSVVIEGDRHVQSPARRRTGRRSAAQVLQAESRGTPSVAGAAQTLVGVTASAPHTDLHIQGGDTGSHSVHLDGVPVRNPTSAGRLLGAFSPLAVEGLTTHKAGYGVLHGSTLSGAIRLEHDLSDRGGRYGTVRIDPLSLNARLREQADVGEASVTALGAGRIGVWGLYQDPALYDLIDRWSTLDPVLAAAQLPPDHSLAGASLGTRARPTASFHDVHGAVRVDWGSMQQLDLSAYHGGSMLGADLALGMGEEGAPELQQADATIASSSPELPVYDRSSWTNTVVQAQYSAPVTTRTVGSLQASLSRYRAASRSEVGPLEEMVSEEQTFLEELALQEDPGPEGSTSVTELTLGGHLDYELGDSHILTFSAGATSLETGLRRTHAFVPRLRHRAHVLRLNTAVEATLGLGRYTTLESGLRLTARPEFTALYAEPRTALRYKRKGTGMGSVALRLAGGLYRQFTAQFNLRRGEATAVVPSSHLWLPVPPSHSPPRTYHLSADVTWQPSPAWQVDLEGYRKGQAHLLELHYPALRNASGRGIPVSLSSFLAPSDGTAYGGGLQVEYDTEVLQSSLRYAYSRSRRIFPGRFEGKHVPVPWNEPHRLTLETEVPLGGGLSVDARGEGIWGRTWGYRRAYYAYLCPSDLEESDEEIDLTSPWDHVLSPLYRVDAGLRLTHSWNGTEVEGRIGFVNLLNRANVADWGLQPRGVGGLDRVERPLPGRRSVVSLQVTF